MAYRRKSWTEKLHDSKGFPKVLEFETRLPCARALESWGAKPGDTVVIAPPLEVDALMRLVPLGNLITIRGICGELARRHGASFCCPLTTGIFINTVAQAAEETGDTGVPYWRTLKVDGSLNPKFPGGEQAQRIRLEEEGFTVTVSRRGYQVEDFEAHLISP